MANKHIEPFAPEYAFAPGETLAEVLEARGMSQRELAERTGLTPKTVNEIVRGKAPVSSETALQFERVLGLPASFWSNLQRRFDEAAARQAEAERLSAWLEWVECFPLKKMAKWKWLHVPANPVDRVRALLNYFGTATPELWKAQWRECQVSFRSATTKTGNEFALACWLRQGEIEAAKIETEPYDAGRFRGSLDTVRRLSALPDIEFVDSLVTVCAASGVAVAFVPELPGIHVYGATRWLSPHKALVQLSLRRKSDDQLWFTFFHESAHILLHPKRAVFIEENGERDALEEAADRFAGDHLIAPEPYQQFVQVQDFSEMAVRRFARELGIAPGIVVGRLQHDHHIGFNRLNWLKRGYKFEELD